MKLLNISDEYFTLLECKRCKAKNTKNLDESNFDHISQSWDLYKMHIRGIKPKKTFPKAYVIQVGFSIINQSKADLTLMNICNKYISLMECERCKTKMTKDLDTKGLKK